VYARILDTIGLLLIVGGRSTTVLKFELESTQFRGFHVVVFLTLGIKLFPYSIAEALCNRSSENVNAHLRPRANGVSFLYSRRY
jgi:hypothetical protein